MSLKFLTPDSLALRRLQFAALRPFLFGALRPVNNHHKFPIKIAMKTSTRTDAFNQFVMNELLKRSRVSVVMQTLLLGLFLVNVIHGESSDSGIWMSSVFILAFSSLRFLLTRLKETSRLRNLNLFYFVVSCQAIGWGALIFTILQTAQGMKDLHLINVLVAAGLLTSANYSLSCSRKIRMTYVSIIMGFLIAHFVLAAAAQGFTMEAIKLPFIMCIFYAFVMAQGQTQFSDWSSLLNSQLHLQGVFDHFPGVISLIRGDRYLMVSRGLDKVFASTAQSLRGNKVGFLGRRSTMTDEYYKFKNSEQRNNVFEGELQTKIGLRTFLIIQTKLVNDDDIMLISLDIHNLKSAEREVLRQRIQLESASKMAALGEMSSGLAHEINNPLTVIGGRVSQIKLFVQNPNSESFKVKVAESLNSIEKTVARIALIVKGLKNFAREGDKVPFSVVALDEVFIETFSFCQARIKNQEIKFEYINLFPALKIKCQSTQLSQVILNLLNNAFDAVADLPSKWIRIEVLYQNTKVSIRISDSGLGIPELLRQKLMTPFFTTKEVGRGTGLGLSISKGIIDNQGGELYFDHAATHTTIVIDLPEHDQVVTEAA